MQASVRAHIRHWERSLRAPDAVGNVVRGGFGQSGRAIRAYRTPRRRKRKQHERIKPLVERNCAGCGRVFTTLFAKFCGKTCYSRHRFRLKPYIHKCVECGSEFRSGLSKASCCSPKCSAERSLKAAIENGRNNPPPRKHASRADAYRVYDFRRRAAYDADAAEVFSAEEIFERDGWLCQICHEEIDQDLVFPHPRSVSLDHVIPIARGGLHRRDNVQCAHLSCNSSKGSRSMQKMRPSPNGVVSILP